MSDIHHLTGAYALDAVDDIERARFEQHLAECEDCRLEVASLREAAGLLSETTAVTPPPALRESVLAAVGPNAPAGEEVILGILSLIVWALILTVSVKYVLILLRANNNGEGGTLALMALAQRAFRGRGLVVVALGHHRRAHHGEPLGDARDVAEQVVAVVGVARQRGRQRRVRRARGARAATQRGIAVAVELVEDVIEHRRKNRADDRAGDGEGAHATDLRVDVDERGLSQQLCR